LKISEIPGAIVISCWCQDDGTVGFTEDQAAEIIRRVEAYNPWIPVSEIAPGLGVWVLVSDTTMIAKGKRIDKTSWFGPEITTIFEKQITHWKSIVLPEQALGEEK